MRRHKPDMVMAILMIILMAVGLVMIYSIGPSWAQFQSSITGDTYADNYFFIRQAGSVVVSLAAFLLAYFFPFDKLRKAARLLMITGLVLSVLLAILGAMNSSMVQCSLGACRWFRLPFGGATLQPVEILKWGILLYMAELIVKHKKAGTLDSKDFMIPLAVVMVVSLFLVAVLQKDLGSAVVITLMVFSMLLVGGMKWSRLFGILGVVALAAVVLVVAFPHRLERIASFSEGGHHEENALLAIGTGGFWGVGIGNSVQATGYLPESINDSVFAIMGETLGFMGLMAVMLVFMVLLLRFLKAAKLYEQGSEGQLVLVGVFAWIMGHVIINVAGMTGLMPMKGITLPFISYGGTSMVFVTAAVGLSLQLSRWTKREEINENIGSGRGQRGTYQSGRGRHRRNLED